MEYCNYILSKKEKTTINIPFESNSECSINELERYVENIVKQYKLSFNLKEKEFSYDKMLIQTVDYFFHSSIVFNKKKADDTIYRLYKHTKTQFKIEKENLNKKKEISYDNMFEIITNFCILCSNTIQNKEEGKNTLITYKTIDINPAGIIEMIGAFNNTINNMEKISFIASQPRDDVKSLANAFIFVASLKINKTDKDICLFVYLCIIIVVTYSRNEELKGIINYGW